MVEPLPAALRLPRVVNSAGKAACGPSAGGRAPHTPTLQELVASVELRGLGIAYVISRKVWLALSALGVLVAVALALLPVRVHFASDPLLRLRDLDPELSPPAATADCGSPRNSLNTSAKGTSLYELARASACRDAGRRRLAVAAAAGSLIIVLGLVGAASVQRGRLGTSRPSTAPIAPVPSG